MSGERSPNTGIPSQEGSGQQHNGMPQRRLSWPRPEPRSFTFSEQDIRKYTQKLPQQYKSTARLQHELAKARARLEQLQTAEQKMGHPAQALTAEQSTGLLVQQQPALAASQPASQVLAPATQSNLPHLMGIPAWRRLRPVAAHAFPIAPMPPEQPAPSAEVTHNAEPAANPIVLPTHEQKVAIPTRRPTLQPLARQRNQQGQGGIKF